MNWYVYIARSRMGYYYTGISNNVESRIEKHNSDKGSLMAKQQGPFVLLYRSLPFPDKSSARKREVQIKKWRRDKKDKLINGEYI